MNLNECYNKTLLEVNDILVASGLIDGSNVSKSSAEKSSSIYFWDNYVKANVIAVKETYVVYKILSLDPLKRADDVVKSRKAYLMLSVFTTKDKAHKSIKNLITNIENNFILNGWKFEFNSDDYIPENTVTHLSFNVYKEIL